MIINFGTRAKPSVPVIWDSKKSVNGHMLVCGMSGAGKTYTLKKIIKEMVETNTNPKLRFHVFDVHGDIDIEGASSVMFSEQTEYGLNPLQVNADPHFGGIRKRTNTFISIVNKVMRSLGEKQEAALRNVLYDVYRNFGFDQDDIKTWQVDENPSSFIPHGLSAEDVTKLLDENRLYIDVPIAEKDDAKLLADVFWEPQIKCWWVKPSDYVGAITRWPPKVHGRKHPSLTDALRLARNISQCSFLGSSLDAITKLEIAHKSARTLQSRKLDALRRNIREFADEKAETALDKAKAKAVEVYTDYVDAVLTGTELEDLMKYQSSDVMMSVVNRLENLDAIGIFKTTTPPFDENNPIWRYDIRALGRDERKLFVLFKCEELFEQAVQRGEQSDIVEIIILDEAHIYIDDDPDNIINTISKEARKFGQALILASQSPTHYPEDFISSVATKIILGIDEMYWKGSAGKMNLGMDALAWIKLKRSLLIQIKAKDATRNEWQWTYTAP